MVHPHYHSLHLDSFCQMLRDTCRPHMVLNQSFFIQFFCFFFLKRSTATYATKYHTHDMPKGRNGQQQTWILQQESIGSTQHARCSRVVQCRVDETPTSTYTLALRTVGIYLYGTVRRWWDDHFQHVMSSTWSSSKPAEKGRRMMRRGFPSSGLIWSQIPAPCSFTHGSSQKGTIGLLI